MVGVGFSSKRMRTSALLLGPELFLALVVLNILMTPFSVKGVGSVVKYNHFLFTDNIPKIMSVKPHMKLIKNLSQLIIIFVFQRHQRISFSFSLELY